MNQAEKAALLRQLHHGDSILRLCNVWDAASARIVEEAGFPAVATSSAGVAFSLGYPDVEAIPAAEMLANVGRIARVVAVPVSGLLILHSWIEKRCGNPVEEPGGGESGVTG